MDAQVKNMENPAIKLQNLSLLSAYLYAEYKGKEANFKILLAERNQLLLEKEKQLAD